ncbi:MAG TPA: molybdopterin-binding protein [Candidatus Thermoplasmatota archaeon]|nr:molybdopterin-binding protein [Candidatus Thermoplasmatota archaeon]
MKRLGCLVIADEILGGHVQESNSHWLAKQVKPLGIKLARVEVCSDDLPDIIASVKRFVDDLDLDYVVTSGGLGPTPDDRTMQGIAAALGRPLVLLPEHEAWMRERCRIGHQLGYFDSPEPNAGLLKMCRLPEGAEAMPNELGTALGAIVTAGRRPTTLFTLPGVPREFYRMFDQSIRPRLAGGTPIHTEDLVLYTEESRLFPLLESLEKEFPDVVLGSYPERGRIRIRATGGADRAKQLIARMRSATTRYLEPQGRFHGDKNVGEAASGLPEIDFDRNH